jgi:hypothetical protein
VGRVVVVGNGGEGVGKRLPAKIVSGDCECDCSDSGVGEWNWWR